MRRRRAGEAGVSLIEIVVAVAVLVGMVGVTFGLMSRAQDLQGLELTQADLQARGRAALERMVRELRDSSRGTFSGLVAGASSITFQRATGFDGSSVLWGPQETLEWRVSPGEIPDNGVDDNGDGLVDEGQIILTTDVGLATQRSVVLCDGVPRYAPNDVASRYGLAFPHGIFFLLDTTGKMLTLSLTLSRRSPRGVVASATMTTSVLLQNP
jgi:hypothetical protein